jgi:hypothetical protein
MRNNLIRTSIFVCIAWCMAGCHAMIDHTEENELVIFVDSTRKKVTQETTRNSTAVTVECKGEVDIQVDRNGRMQNVDIKDR